MKEFRVEFYTNGVWETIDVLTHLEADSEIKAIEFAKDWCMDNAFDRETAEQEINDRIWRATEIKYDEDGCPESYNWVQE